MAWKFYEEVYFFRCWELIAIMFIAIGAIEFYVKCWSWAVAIFILLAALIYVVFPSIKREKTTPNKTKQRGQK
jgi:hypothetical protein